MIDPLEDGAVSAEIEALHRFFATWYRGDGPRDEVVFRRELTGRLHGDFAFVASTGAVMDGPAFAREVWHAYGASPDMVITVTDVRIGHRSGGTVLATYQEWQRSGGEEVGVIASVLLERGPPLLWLHVHETPLAGPMPADFVDPG